MPGRSSMISSSPEESHRIRRLPLRRTSLLATACLVVTGAVCPAARAHVGPAPAVPQGPDPSAPAVRVEKVGEGAWALFGRGGNVGVVATEEAVLVVDTDYEKVAPALLDEIRKLSDAPIHYVVNTHFHGDHVGGNPVMIREARLARIVGHENVRRRLYEGPARWARDLPEKIRKVDAALGSARALGSRTREVLEGALSFLKRRVEASLGFDAAKVVAPGVTYDGSLQLHLGGLEIVLLHEGAGHTDGDSIVWVPRLKVVHMGDLFWNGLYPFIDVDGGGGTEGWIRNIDSILREIPEDARVIPGHGAVAGPDALRRFRGYLVELRRAVAESMEAGLSLEEAIEKIRLRGYEDIEPAFMSLPRNVHQVWQELGGDVAP